MFAVLTSGKESSRGANLQSLVWFAVQFPAHCFYHVVLSGSQVRGQHIHPHTYPTEREAERIKLNVNTSSVILDERVKKYIKVRKNLHVVASHEIVVFGIEARVSGELPEHVVSLVCSPGKLQSSHLQPTTNLKVVCITCRRGNTV